MDVADGLGFPGTAVEERTAGRIEVSTIDRAAELEARADALDRLAPSRGPHADLYDTASWLLSWLAAGPQALERGLRILVADAGERPVAMLPLFARSAGDWTIAGLPMRPRFRAVIGSPEPDGGTREALGLLVEQAARRGMRSLDVPAMPPGDPATGILAAALERAGFRVRRHRASADTLTRLEGPDRDAFRRRLKVFESNARRRERKAARLGDISLRAWFSETGRAAVTEGFAVYRDVHARSWKGEPHPRTVRHRAELLERAARRGWVQVLALYVAGVAASAHIWFRLGARAISYSTVYDARLAALGPGSILVWKGLERMIRQDGLEVIDFLPGRGAQKEELATSRPALESLEARRGVQLAVPRALHGAVRVAGRPVARCAALVASAARRPSSARVPETHLRAAPASAGAFAPLTLDPGLELWLAATGGFRNVRSMRETWGEGDHWLVLGSPPRAAARLDAGGAPRELVLVGEDTSLDEAAEQLAGALGRALDDAVIVHRAILPWPRVTPSSMKAAPRRDRTPARRA